MVLYTDVCDLIDVIDVRGKRLQIESINQSIIIITNYREELFSRHPDQIM
jgi:hypothetical protein